MAQKAFVKSLPASALSKYVDPDGVAIPTGAGGVEGSTFVVLAVPAALQTLSIA